MGVIARIVEIALHAGYVRADFGEAEVVSHSRSRAVSPDDVPACETAGHFPAKLKLPPLPLKFRSSKLVQT